MDRERDPATIELLKNLRTKLFSENISYARVAAFNLSWMQEDGLTILKEAILGDYSKTVKKAAAYGLRNMRGRMKKLAIEVLEQGQQSQDTMTREACAKSLYLLVHKPAPRPKRAPRQKIKELPPRSNGNTAYKKAAPGHQVRKGGAPTGYRNGGQPQRNDNAPPIRNGNVRRPGGGNYHPPRKPGGNY